MSEHTSDRPHAQSDEPPLAVAPSPAALAAPPPTHEPPAAPPLFPPVETAERFRPGHPVLGPALWTFGALLWAYLVMGECVLSFGLPEAVGASMVLLAYALAWLVSVPDTTTPAARWQKLVPGCIGLALFVATLFFTATLFGTSRRSHIAFITMLLWFFSAAMFLLGRRWTLRTRTQRRWPVAGSVALWVISGLVTLVALASTLSRA